MTLSSEGGERRGEARGRAAGSSLPLAAPGRRSPADAPKRGVTTNDKRPLLCVLSPPLATHRVGFVLHVESIQGFPVSPLKVTLWNFQSRTPLRNESAGRPWRMGSRDTELQAGPQERTLGGCGRAASEPGRRKVPVRTRSAGGDPRSHCAREGHAHLLLPRCVPHVEMLFPGHSAGTAGGQEPWGQMKWVPSCLLPSSRVTWGGGNNTVPKYRP